MTNAFIVKKPLPLASVLASAKKHETLLEAARAASLDPLVARKFPELLNAVDALEDRPLTTSAYARRRRDSARAESSSSTFMSFPGEKS